MKWKYNTKNLSTNTGKIKTNWRRT